jgi:DNA-binding response OmpR family regulator
LEAELEILDDGGKAVHWIRQADQDASFPIPDLILLDLNLPRKSGTDVLKLIRRSPRFDGVGVIITTSSDSERDSREAAVLGANGYFRKPSNYAAFLRLGVLVKEFLMNQGSVRLA